MPECDILKNAVEFAVFGRDGDVKERAGWETGLFLQQETKERCGKYA